MANVFQKVYIYFFLAILLRIAFIFILPPTQTPDETYIFQRIWAITTNSISQDPSVISNKSIYYPNNEYYYPPLYFYFSSVIIKSLSLFHTPQNFSDAYQAFYIPLRLTSLILTSISLILIWKILQRFSLQNSIKIAVFAFISLLPTFTAFSIAANHNVLLFFLITVLVYLLTGKNSPLLDSKKSALLGTVFGLALLTKFDAIIILPVLILSILHVQKNIAFYRNLLIFLIFLIISGGWWYLLNLLNHGWLWDQNLFNATLKEYTLPFTFDNYILNALALTVITFFATFGIYNDIFLRLEIYGLFFIIVILFPIGLQKSISHLNNRPQSIVFIGGGLSFLLNTLIFSQINFFTVFQAQGRYFFPSLLFISLILVLGISHFFRKENYYLIPIILLVSGFFLNYWSLGCIIGKFYHFSPLPPLLNCIY